MQQFEFILPNEKKKLYDRFALLLFLLNMAGIILKMFYASQKEGNTVSLYLSAGALLLLTCPNLLVYKNKVRRYLKIFAGAAIALSLYWFWLGPWWAGLLVLILTFFYTVAQRELKIEVAALQISYPSFPKKIIQWNELNNLVLKDGLLTIDFKNDKIIQHYPEAKMNPVNEQEFNEFCRQQLMSNR
jgi:hypothetical protein